MKTSPGVKRTGSASNQEDPKLVVIRAYLDTETVVGSCASVVQITVSDWNTNSYGSNPVPASGDERPGRASTSDGESGAVGSPPIPSRKIPRMDVPVLTEDA